VADLTLDQIKKQAGIPDDWVAVQGAPIKETKPIIQQPDPLNPDAPQVPTTAQVDTGQWYIEYRSPTGQNARVYVQPGQPIPADVARSAAGEAYPGLDTPINLNAAPTPTWVITGAPDLGKAADAKPPVQPGDIIRLDIKGNVIPDGDTTTPVAKLQDRITRQIADMPASTDPAGTPMKIGNKIIIVKPDGTFVDTKLEVPTEKAAVTVPGLGAFSYDPATGIFTPGPAVKEEPKYEIRDGWTYLVDPDDPSKFTKIESLPRQPTATSVRENEFTGEIEWYDQQGNLVNKQPIAGWKPKLEPLETDTTREFISKWDPSTQTAVWVKNENRQTASDAILQMAKDMGAAVGEGTISEEQAKNILEQAWKKMAAETAQTAAAASMLTAQTGEKRLPIEQQQADAATLAARTGVVSGGVNAAQAGLTALQQGASTGAGMLNQRAQTSAGLLGNLNQQFLGSQALRAPNVAGPGLASAIGNWMTELGGGAGTYQAAANMVQRADPNGRLGADSAKYFGALGQALEKFEAMTGQPHPLAVAASTPAPTTGGLTAPSAEPQLGAVVQPQPQLSPLGGVVANSLGGPMQTYGRFPESAAMAMQRHGMGAPVTINVNP
jgi:hypothetical protein